MGLWSRVRHLLRADAHGVVDALEDEPLLLRQCLRDAEAALAERQTRLAGLADEQKALAERAAGLERRIEALDADVELALSEGREDLARYGVRRLLPLREARTAAAERMAAVEAEHRALAEAVAEQRETLRETEARIRARLGQIEQARAGAPVEPDPRTVTDEDVELELLRRRREGGA